MANYKNNLQAIKQQIKTTPETPVQKVVQVKEKVTENDTPLNVRIPKDLLKRVKAHGFHNELSLKDITVTALEEYLNK